MTGRHRHGPRTGSEATRERRDDIQGLRGLAVLAVVLFHAGVPGIGGGFTGVDCFFVISAFLITGQLLRDADANGRPSLGSFYARRARRILPAALLVLLVTAGWSLAVLDPLRARSVLRDCLATSLFAGNYRFAATGSNYLAADTPPSPVLHFWSLGVEEQFYLLWPLLIGIALVLGRRRLPRVTVVVLAAVTAASSIACTLQTRVSPPWAFYSLPTRGWEFGVGGLAAVFVARSTRLSGMRLSQPLAWAGLVGLGWSFVRLGAHTPWPGTAAWVPVAATAVVLVGRDRTVLKVAPLRWIGDRSYAWYLWHWPPMVLVPVMTGSPLSMTARAGLAAATLGLADLTLRFVENPLRYASPMRRPRIALPAAVAAIAVSAIACAGSIAVVPPARGTGRAVATAKLPVHALVAAPAGRPLSAEEVDDRTVAPVVAEAVQHRPLPRNLQPALNDAADDKAAPFLDGCNLTWTAVDQPPCAYTSGARSIVLLGDSHAAQWFPPLRDIAQSEHLRLQSWTKTTCPPLQLDVFSPYLGRAYTECAQWRVQAIARIRAERPALVVIGVARHYDSQYHFAVYGKAWLDGLAATVRTIRAAGVRVLVMGPTPKPPSDVPSCLAAHLGDVAACDFPRSVGFDSAGIASERAAVQTAGGEYLDVTPWNCTATTCAVVVGNLLVYRDDNHLTTVYAQWLRPLLERIVLQGQ